MPVFASTRDVVLRRAVLALFDATCWFIATVALVGARYDFAINEVQWGAVLVYAATVMLLQVAGGAALQLYRGRFPIGSFDEALHLGALVLAIALVVGMAFLLLVTEFPRGLAVSVPPGALMLMATARWAYRALREFQHPQAGGTRDRALLYGAGDLSAHLLRLMDHSPNPPFDVVGLIDDDPAKRWLRLSGRRVLGTGQELGRLAHSSGATHVVLAIGGDDKDLLRSISETVDAHGLKLLTLPAFQRLGEKQPQLENLHEVDVTDLLGRGQVDTDLTAIADYLSNRVVLITGAGGSIGSEIARQVHAFGPKELVLLDRDESALHGVQLSIYGQGLLDTPDMVLCDIRDAEALERVFEAHKPDVVFHAAALKHLPMLEQYPDEGWKTNVLGTLNVLDGAYRHGASHVVNISTDKAADPTSVLGKTKRIAEELTAWYADAGLGTFLSVRFGNVLGSRGSMLHTFTNQIRQGGPVTVTHPDVTRYFMTIREACQLTIQAGAIGQDGEVLVLDMGTPVSILEVAERLIAKSGKDVEIVFTGLRSGEKLHEVLFNRQESGTPSAHPLISRVDVPARHPSEVLDQPLTLLSTGSLTP
ncbi:polysaccharide biosynthesis protein [Auraticoccus monumenti]|uniref:dTDP-glucose 4,6-dehydratase n=1 Tax=Auraticoccus monumenti TaxID=675864 RepID=A0A1G7F463_9ACTN|nr:nucleoside-diphosphate sugar epimerase/dehydratase [Auraticoccus monumenti]SDE70536.1 dTDP-glucose 4,6-dehydratase [Auraticoccus monumenti]